jgi:hypothetical protein
VCPKATAHHIGRTSPRGHRDDHQVTKTRYLRKVCGQDQRWLKLGALRLLGDGRSNEEIADALFLSHGVLCLENDRLCDSTLTVIK